MYSFSFAYVSHAHQSNAFVIMLDSTCQDILFFQQTCTFYQKKIYIFCFYVMLLFTDRNGEESEQRPYWDQQSCEASSTGWHVSYGPRQIRQQLATGCPRVPRPMGMTSKSPGTRGLWPVNKTAFVLVKPGQGRVHWTEVVNRNTIFLYGFKLTKGGFLPSEVQRHARDVSREHVGPVQPTKDHAVCRRYPWILWQPVPR